jgi:hypothetical protein
VAKKHHYLQRKKFLQETQIAASGTYTNWEIASVQMELHTHSRYWLEWVDTTDRTSKQQAAPGWASERTGQTC